MSGRVTRGAERCTRAARRSRRALLPLLALAALACGDDAGAPPAGDLGDMDAGRTMDGGRDAAGEEDARVVPPPIGDAASDARTAEDAAPDAADDDGGALDCGDLDCDAMSDECNVGVCDEVAVACRVEPRADGSACGSDALDNCSAPDTCQQGQCVANHAVAGTPCGDQGQDCHVDDECDGEGHCVDHGLAPVGSGCGDQLTNDDCNDPDTCDALGVCQPNYAPPDSLCGDVGELCRYDDRCDAQGQCIDSGHWELGQCPMGEVAEGGQDYCRCGSTARDLCHPGPDVCIAGTCRRGHEQFAPDGITTDGTPCGNGDPIDPECDNPDECLNGQCEQNGVAAGTPCGNQVAGDPVCDAPDSCDGFGTCDPRWATMDTVCGAMPGECWLEPLCDGLGDCASAAPAPPTTACGSQVETECDLADTCDGAGDCDPHLQCG